MATKETHAIIDSIVLAPKVNTPEAGLWAEQAQARLIASMHLSADDFEAEMKARLDNLMLYGTTHPEALTSGR